VPLDPQVAALLAEAAASGARQLWELPLAEARAQATREMLAKAGPPEPVESVLELVVPASPVVPVTLFRPAGVSAPVPALVFFHGGGWVLGERRTHESLCRALSNAADIAVASVEYRLAPEHPFPAASADAWAATAWIAERAASLVLDPERLAVGGDSAGGNLAATVARRARDEGLGLACQLLVYPATDLAHESSSYEQFAEGYGLTRTEMRWYIDLYLQGAAPDDPLASPLGAADFEGLPPAIVATVEYDVLRDEGEAYAAALARSGVPVELRRFAGLAHGSIGDLGAVDRAREAMLEIAALLRKRLG
jgi:acetyl esterase